MQQGQWGTVRSVIITDVGLAGIHTLIVCKAGVLRACPPGSYEKLHHMSLNLRAILVLYQPSMFL